MNEITRVSEIFEWVSQGWVLGITKESAAAVLVRPWFQHKKDVPVNVAIEATKSRLMFQLTEFRIGTSDSYRKGWRDMGLDGITYSWWVMRQ